MPSTAADLTDDALAFLAERHLCTCTTLRADGTPHATPTGFTWDPAAGLARVICSGTSQKARNVRATGRVALCSVDGRRWLTLEGPAVVREDPDSVADAEARYAARYQQPRENPRRVVIEVAVDRVLGWQAFRADR
ncbi:TIGR03618 family F420-dependent PPOX class oxidoreductase [Conexibacter sp. W3-3-2]|uniref:PPOX class F420-dependent oxidoreductase n=1 Tax=Conexibacter sp. W3-3-2 TaxID=2675227 RepID=UPI001320D54C|nr:PPOX class F420-dependent oxidoreductase [Conexibacter sp. W3-3-2]MTD43615.1 TIGR03618 family F420-dependent PPOX class oxidoreductase [Conexibacter sp. W3-3-2]